jgi:hypothetical protein
MVNKKRRALLWLEKNEGYFSPNNGMALRPNQRKIISGGFCKAFDAAATSLISSSSE